MPTLAEAAAFTPAELLLFLQSLPATTSAESCVMIDQLFHLYERRSFELRTAFLVAALRAGMEGAPERAIGIVLAIGRMKFLRPLYTALAARLKPRRWRGRSSRRLRRAITRSPAA